MKVYCKMALKPKKKSGLFVLGFLGTLVLQLMGCHHRCSHFIPLNEVIVLSKEDQKKLSYSMKTSFLKEKNNLYQKKKKFLLESDNLVNVPPESMDFLYNSSVTPKEDSSD